MKKSYGYGLLMLVFSMTGSMFADLIPPVTIKLAPGVASDAVGEVIGAVAEIADNALGKGEDRITPEKAATFITEQVIGGVATAVENAMGPGPSLDQRVGDFVGGAVKHSLQSGLQGIEDATEGDKVGNITRNVVGNVGKEASRGLSEALKDEELGKNLEEAGEAWSVMTGRGARGARKGFQKNVAPHIEEGFRDLLSSFANVRNMFQYGSIIAGSIAIPAAGYYASRVFWNVLEKRLTNPKPEIIVKQANPKFGRWDRVKRWWAGYQTPPMIFDQSVKDRLSEIENKTIAIRDLIRQGRKMTYDNLLLYGKPGTGKTLFAQILADITDMDFLPVTAASLLQSGVEGIKYFNELLELANRSKYGVIIFVDEADALFIDRNSLSPESDHYKVLNHILALTGTGSSKFMLIAATNHAYVMDEAMGRRFQDRVLMPLPDATTRLALLDLYFASTLLNIKENSSEFVSQAQSLLSASMTNQIVQKTAGLSHAEIKDMVSTMNKTAQISTITAKIIKNTVDQAVEKHKVLEEEKAQREERAAKN